MYGLDIIISISAIRAFYGTTLELYKHCVKCNNTINIVQESSNLLMITSIINP